MVVTVAAIAAVSVTVRVPASETVVRIAVLVAVVVVRIVASHSNMMPCATLSWIIYGHGNNRIR